MPKLISPTGIPIIGSLESLQGVAQIVGDSFRRDATGKLEFDYEGETNVSWDTQEIVVERGRRIFVDEQDSEWPEDRLHLEGEPALVNEPDARRVALLCRAHAMLSSPTDEPRDYSDLVRDIEAELRIKGENCSGCGQFIVGATLPAGDAFMCPECRAIQRSISSLS